MNEKLLYVFTVLMMANTGIINVAEGASNNLRRVLRIKKFIITNDDSSLGIRNLTVHGSAYDERISGIIELKRDAYIDFAKFEINRCQHDGFNCEYFQTWTLRNNLHKLIYLKNQMWSPMLNAVTPKLTFPAIKKNTFILQNGTADANAIVAFYSDAPKYYFDVKFYGIHAERNRTDLWINFAFNIFEYRKRNRPADQRSGKFDCAENLISVWNRAP